MKMPKLDHLVLPTVSLDAARARLTALGFTVAPEGVHPFGTRNCCVYFEDDTFLEPLAIADTRQAEAAIAAGNVFVGRDRKFRDKIGEEGFSALVLASDDADRDHARFVEEGISAGERLDFSRSYRDAEGVEREVSFRLAFAAPAGASFFFTCERLNAPEGGRGALAAHPNGVAGIAGIVATGGDMAASADFLSRFSGEAAKPAGTGFRLELANAAVEIADAADIPASDELRLTAIVFAGADTGRLLEDLQRANITHTRRDGRLIVPPVLGQGAAFIFEDRP